MADLSITGAGPHASATATDHIPATASGASGYLTPLQLATYTSTAMSNLVLSGQSLTGSSATSNIDAAVTWNTTGTPTAWKLNVTDTASNAYSCFLGFQAGGVNKFHVDKSGSIYPGGSYGGTVNDSHIGGDTSQIWFKSVNIVIASLRHPNWVLGSSGAFAWSSAANASGGTVDTLLYRDAANTLAQRNGTNAQTFRVYNTYTDASNYERGYIGWSANVLYIGAESAGTGTQRKIFLGTTAGKGVEVNTSSHTISMKPSGGPGPVFADSAISFNGWHASDYPIFGTTQSGYTDRNGQNVLLYPLGGSGSGTAAQVGLYASLATVSGTAGHTFELAVRTFLPAAGQPGLQFGGTTSSFPAFKRTGTALNVRLADDSADGSLSALVSPTAAADANSLGYLGAPQNSQSVAYTFALSDAGKHIYHPAADTTARTFTIPANASVAFPIGTIIAIVNENGAGTLTLDITSDTLRWGSSTGSRTIAPNGVASLLKVTATVWRLTGEGIT